MQALTGDKDLFGLGYCGERDRAGHRVPGLEGIVCQTEGPGGYCVIHRLFSFLKAPLQISMKGNLL